MPAKFLSLQSVVAVGLMLGHACAAQQGLETHTPFPAPVLNAPYSAKRVTTTYQKLADGTQISHERTTLIARDSLGHTWSEFPVESKDALRRNGKTFTGWVLWDPITFTMTSWCDCNHVAWKRQYDPPRPAMQGNPARRQQPGVNVDIGPENDRMRYVLKPLPAQDILGIHAEGSKATRTVPAGRDGNDRDLTWTVQSWYSPDLKLALVTIVDDPVKGITKYEFRDLKRAEPPASLFQVPEGYVMRTAKPLDGDRQLEPVSPDFAR